MAAHSLSLSLSLSRTHSRRISLGLGSASIRCPFCAVELLHGRTAGRSVCLCLINRAPTPVADLFHPFGPCGAVSHSLICRPVLWGCGAGLGCTASCHFEHPFVTLSFLSSWRSDVVAADLTADPLALKSHEAGCQNSWHTMNEQMVSVRTVQR
ncbi:hypothetical protein IWX48DRAFT_274624 [Phyllosticta citricarpa]